MLGSCWDVGMRCGLQKDSKTLHLGPLISNLQKGVMGLRFFWAVWPCWASCNSSEDLWIVKEVDPKNCLFRFFGWLAFYSDSTPTSSTCREQDWYPKNPVGKPAPAVLWWFLSQSLCFLGPATIKKVWEPSESWQAKQKSDQDCFSQVLREKYGEDAVGDISDISSVSLLKRIRCISFLQTRSEMVRGG